MLATAGSGSSTPGAGLRRGRPAVLDAAQTAIIPLRPLTVGEILDAGFLVMRRNARQMLGLPLAIAGGAALWMLLGVGVWFLLGNTTVRGVQIVGVVLVGLIGLLLLVLSLVWVTALLSRITMQTALGEGFAPAGSISWRSALPILGPMIGLAGLQYVAISVLQTVAGVIYYAIVLVSLAAGEDWQIGGGIVALLVSFAAYALGYGYLSLTVPALANESRRSPGWIGKPAKPTNPLSAFERSFRLVGLKGAGRIMGLFAGALAVSLAIVVLVALGLSGLLFLFATSLGHQVGELVGNPWVIGGVLAVSSVVALSAVVAFMSGVQTLLYLDLRMRREGLDLALRFDCVPVPQPVAPPVMGPFMPQLRGPGSIPAQSPGRPDQPSPQFSRRPG